jgi:hypothetical protein
MSEPGSVPMISAVSLRPSAPTTLTEPPRPAATTWFVGDDVTAVVEDEPRTGPAARPGADLHRHHSGQGPGGGADQVRGRTRRRRRHHRRRGRVVAAGQVAGRSARAGGDADHHRPGSREQRPPARSAGRWGRSSRRRRLYGAVVDARGDELGAPRRIS